MSSGVRPRGRGSPKSKDAETLIERDSGNARRRHKNMGLSGGCICDSKTPRQAAAAMESDKTCDKMEDGAALAVSTGWGRGNLLCLTFGEVECAIKTERAHNSASETNLRIQRPKRFSHCRCGSAVAFSS
ncbi:hypothetical protein PIB30_050744 [Stylosanthes scabra]|uniref:Uncharacterized protein n=1 Tax=Stylosanthes scabra TaxID=79078 RepID=A0ABU6RHW7_9FABA|nr:hypothetical protein [Stylosanthes scabra]